MGDADEGAARAGEARAEAAQAARARSTPPRGPPRNEALEAYDAWRGATAGVAGGAERGPPGGMAALMRRAVEMHADYRAAPHAQIYETDAVVWPEERAALVECARRIGTKRRALSGGAGFRVAELAVDATGGEGHVPEQLAMLRIAFAVYARVARRVEAAFGVKVRCAQPYTFQITIIHFLPFDPLLLLSTPI